MMKNSVLVVFAAYLLLSCPEGRMAHASESGGLRVISLAPSSTEILFALGLDDEVVGVSQYCNYPERALAKERVGTFSQPDIEKIMFLKPDMIFCTSLEQAPSVTRLRRLGFKVCVSDPSTVEELFASIDEVGGLVGRPSEARSLISGMRAGLESIAGPVTSVPMAKRPKVYVEFWNSPIMTAGRGSLIDELITLAGGVNIASSAKARYSSFSPEEVVKRDPDCVILGYMQSPGALDSFKSRFGWGDISAVRNGRVYNDIDSNIILRPGPRAVQGVLEMHKRFYPDGI
ncbi:MAG: cobalamin-binding protein [Candidatus Omnitrophota bacterium]